MVEADISATPAGGGSRAKPGISPTWASATCPEREHAPKIATPEVVAGRPPHKSLIAPKVRAGGALDTSQKTIYNMSILPIRDGYKRILCQK